MLNLKNAALVTHQGCMDGSTCAILFIAAGGQKQNIFFSSPNHNDVDDIVLDLQERWPGTIILADISVSEECAKKIYRNDVFLLDHHKSAIPLKEFRWCEIDVNNNRCGSKMLFDWLQEEVGINVEKYKNLVTYVDDNDRWVKDYPQSDILSMLHQVLSQELFIDRFVKNSNPDLDNMEQYVISLEERKREKFIEHKKKELVLVEKEIGGQNVKIAFVQASQHQSLLGNSICVDPSIGADVTVLVGSTISMRARKNSPVDLSVVAKINGGGGHQLAAGCSLDKLLGNSLVNFVINNLKFE